jgi:phosphoribosylformylglycinamidine cyclo-ligase
VLDQKYGKKYPESYSPETDGKYVYSGSKSLTDTIAIDGVDHHVGKLLLSPTRTFLPVLHTILRELKGEIRGIIHNTGGGQTKVKRFLGRDQMVVKDGLPDCPPIFKLIQEESKTSWEEMYQVFNMGSRMEIYVSQQIAEEIIAIAHAYNIDAWVVGRVEKSDAPAISVLSDYGAFRYA